jgi:hypothetical protein
LGYKNSKEWGFNETSSAELKTKGSRMLFFLRSEVCYNKAVWRKITNNFNVFVFSSSCEFSPCDGRKRSFELTADIVINTADAAIATTAAAAAAASVINTADAAVAPAAAASVVNPAIIPNTATAPENDYCPMAPAPSAAATPKRATSPNRLLSPPPAVAVEIAGDYCLMSVNKSPEGLPRLEPVVGATIAISESPAASYASAAAAANNNYRISRSVAAPATGKKT